MPDEPRTIHYDSEYINYKKDPKGYLLKIYYEIWKVKDEYVIDILETLYYSQNAYFQVDYNANKKVSADFSYKSFWDILEYLETEQKIIVSIITRNGIKIVKITECLIPSEEEIENKRWNR